MVQRILVVVGGLLILVLVGSSLGGIDLVTSINSCLLVLGGTFLCGLLAYPLETFRKTWSSLLDVRDSEGPDYAALVNQIEALARMRRLSGPRALDKAVESLNNIFMRKGLELIADGYTRHEILCIMEKEYEFYFAEKEAQIGLLNTLARFAPAFGFIGTIIGLINIMNNMSDPKLLGPGMAMALLTTLFGLLFANICFLPLAKKLSEYLRQEALFMNVTLEGLLDIAESKNPIAIVHRLQSYLNIHLNSQIHPARSRRKAMRKRVRKPPLVEPAQTASGETAHD